jgi:glycine/D-amino acid oxidase-like deaminating enzyme
VQEVAVTQEADAVVIGAGAFGASTAFHLARLGRRVVLLDRHEPASQTSPRAAGLAGQLRSTETMSRVAILSVEKLLRFEAETGQPLEAHQSGSLKLLRRPEQETHLAEEIARGRRLGLELELLPPEEARRRSPFLRPHGVRTVLHTPTDLYFEPGQLALGYVRAAAGLGATVLPRTAVTGVGTRAGAVEHVVTSRGPIHAPVVVDTAGAWARLVGAAAGLRVPAVATRHQLLITEPIPGVADEQPIVRIPDAQVYVRPAGGGLMLGGYEADPVQYDMGTLPSDFQVQDLALDLGVLRGLVERVAELFPVFDQAPVRLHRGGLPTMTPDGRPLVGPAPGLGGLFIAAGCCVGGLSISPAVGALLAGWIVNGRPSIDLALLAPERFDAEYRSEERLLERCRHVYAHYYDLVH